MKKLDQFLYLIGEKAKLTKEKTFQKKTYIAEKIKCILSGVDINSSKVGSVIEEAFAEVFQSDDRFATHHYGRLADATITNITKTHLSDRLSGYQRSLIEPIDEIKTCQNILRLLAYAIGENLPESFEEKEASAIKKRLMFEARRKLVLMLLGTEVLSERERVLKIGEYEISKVITGLTSAPLEIPTKKIINEKDDSLIAISTPNCEYPDARKKKGIKIEDDIDMKREMSVKNPEGEKDTIDVIIEARTPKTEEEMTRKVLARGQGPETFHDIFGNYFAVDCSKKWATTRHVREVSWYKLNGRHVTKEVEDYGSVFAIIDAIEKSNKSIRIIDYKPSPPPGGRVKSSGGGGGAKLTYSKFYVQLGEEKKEFFIFPSRETAEEGGRIQSGLFYKQEKIDQSKDYGVQRLGEESGGTSYSALNVFFPQEYYGSAIEKISKRK